MAEITAATQEQNQRITEVSHSVGSLEEMTQQNAALVERLPPPKASRTSRGA